MRTEILKLMEPDDELVIEDGQPSIGGRSVTPVESLSCGCDWDAGKVFVRPQDKLRRESKTDLIAQRFLHRILDIQAIEDMTLRGGHKPPKANRTKSLRDACEKAIGDIDELRNKS